MKHARFGLVLRVVGPPLARTPRFGRFRAIWRLGGFWTTLQRFLRRTCPIIALKREVLVLASACSVLGEHLVVETGSQLN